ncbi:MAG: hypothetical protein LBQ54_14055 [Planctomycetaceae bacterium]|nr:hypothetical protein [Planctomycetaceae bacterium]
MTSRIVVRSFRFGKLFRCFTLFIGTAAFLCVAVTAHAQLSWKTPEVSGFRKTALQSAALKPGAATLKPEVTVSTPSRRNPVQQVQYNTEQVPGLPRTPSPDAVFDTTHPELRPPASRTNSPVAIPMPVPASPPATVTIPAPAADTFDEADDYSNYGNMVIPSGKAGCPDPREITKPMSELSYDISMTATNMPTECPINYGDYVPRNWPVTCFQFKASALCTKATYFEDVDLERYGHSWGPFLQPVISGGKFFLTIPFLPYKMGLVPPNECVYTLGHYRPGSCAPYIIDPLPLSIRAGLFEAGAIVGGIYLIP